MEDGSLHAQGDAPCISKQQTKQLQCHLDTEEQGQALARWYISDADCSGGLEKGEVTSAFMTAMINSKIQRSKVEADKILEPMMAALDEDEDGEVTWIEWIQFLEAIKPGQDPNFVTLAATITRIYSLYLSHRI